MLKKTNIGPNDYIHNFACISELIYKVRLFMAQYVIGQSSQTQPHFRQTIFQHSQIIYNAKKLQLLKQIMLLIDDLSQDRRNQQVIELLIAMIEERKQCVLQELFKNAASRIYQIIKETVQQIKQETYQKQKDFYLKAANFNSFLANLSSCKEKNKEWLNFFDQPSRLVGIDLLPYFFHQNRYYLENTFFQFPMWSGVELGSFVQLPGDSLFKIYRYYCKNTNMVSLKMHSCLINRIAVFTLARFKARIKNWRKKKYTIIDVQPYIKKYKTFEDKGKISSMESSIALPTITFRLCEIIIFTREKEVNIVPMLSKQVFLKSLMDIIGHSSDTAKQQGILSLKMQFHLPLSQIYSMLSHISNHGEENISVFFEKQVLKDLAVLERKIQFAFTFQNSIPKAIKSFNLQQDYKTKITDVKFVGRCRSDVIACFTKATLKTFKRYSDLTDLQLRVQQFVSPIFAINRFHLSYNDLNGISQQTNKEDLILTLILATQGDQVIFHQTKRERLSNESYVQALRQILSAGIKALPPAVVLFEEQIENPIKWSLFCQFVNFIQKQYRSRVYVSFGNPRIKLADTLLIYVRQYMRMLSPLIQKEHFFPSAEKCIEKVIKCYAQLI